MSASDVRDYYEAYWRRDELAVYADPLAKRRLALLREDVVRSGARRVLDVGCGEGGVVSALHGDGLDALGMDVSAAAVARATATHPACRFVRHGVEELPWPVEPGSLDLVASFEVIEHLLQPNLLLEGARDALAPGGRLALTTPYHGRAKNVVLALTAFDRHFAVDGDHIRFFTDAALRASFERAGFAIERICHFGRFWPLWAGVYVLGRKR